MRTDLKGLRRFGVAAVAAVTIGGLVPVIAATSAVADTGTRITITPSAQNGAAGTCLAYTVNVVDDFGRPATDTGTVNVTLTENPNSATQDVDFCTLPATSSTPASSTFAAAPSYSNAPRNGSVTECLMAQEAPGCTLANPRQSYAPGTSVTSPASNAASTTTTASNSNNPDSADNAATSANTNNNANPSGTDRATFVYGQGDNPTSAIAFGVVGLTPGGANITAFLDRNNNGTREAAATGPAAEPTFTATATFREGGRPGSPDAANAARQVTVTPTQSVKPQSAPNHSFQVTVRNASGDTLSGVTVSYVVTSGPGTTTTARDCTAQTNNSGVTTCTYAPTAAGTDTLQFYVNQTGASSTERPDTNEPSTTATAITTPPPVARELAYSIDLQPDTASTPTGTNRDFTAVVTAANGAPARLVEVTFVENGPGTFAGATDSNGTSVFTGQTDDTGRVAVTVVTTAGQTGNQTIGATINNPTTTQCQTAGGRCSDSSTHTIVAGASPSASASNSASASASPSASGSTSPSATASATGSATAQPTGTTTAPTQQLALRVTSPSTITPGQGSVLRATGQPNSVVVLRCYSRPSTDYFDARNGSIGTDGEIEFRLNPGTNTRCFVKYAGAADNDARNSASVVQNVATALSLTVIRNGVRDYTFQGRILPRRSGQLITLYRVDNNGREVLTSQVKTDSTGTWRIRRVFTGSGRFNFIARTGQNLTNVAGKSNVRPTAIF